jgi:hypothetical protein
MERTRPVGWAREVGRTLRGSPAFAAALVLTLAAAAFNGLLVTLMALRLDGLLPDPFAQMGHFTQVHHRVHDLTFALLFLPTLVGVLAQVRRPANSIGPMLMALGPQVGLGLTLVLTVTLSGNAQVLQPPWLMVGAAVLIATGLHPAGRDFPGAFRLGRASPPMLAATTLAVIPWVGFAATNIRLQGAVTDDHAAAGHYGFMAAFALTALALALLASLRPVGWRLTAGVAALLPTLLAAASIAYPEATSSLSLPWATAAITWSLAFSVAARLATHPRRPPARNSP